MEKCNWETTFDTANKTMTHIFSEKMKVVTDFNIIKVYKDDSVIYQRDCKMSVEDYCRLLMAVANNAKELEDERTNH